MIWIVIIVVGLIIYFMINKEKENTQNTNTNIPKKSIKSENSNNEKDAILQKVAKYSDDEMTPEEFENSVELYRILQPIDVEHSNQEVIVQNFDNKVLNIVHNTFKHGVWRANDKMIAEKCFEDKEYIQKQQSLMIKDFELNFEDSYSSGVDQKQAQNFIKKWGLIFKNNALDNFQTKKLDSRMIFTFEQQMFVNGFVAGLEGLSNKRTQVLNYKNDQDSQLLAQSYFHGIFAIALDKIEDLTIKNSFTSDRDYLGQKIDSFTQLISSILNSKNTFVEISKMVEQWLSNTLSEINHKAESLSKNNDEKMDFLVNDFSDVVTVAKAEKLYNDGTLLFSQGKFEEANKYFEQAAELNDKDALYQLGNSFLEGKGVKQDNVRAYECYFKAANLNHMKAQYNLGLFLLQGTLGEADVTEGRKWITKSALNGYSEAQNVLDYLNKMK